MTKLTGEDLRAALASLPEYPPEGVAFLNKHEWEFFEAQGCDMSRCRRTEPIPQVAVYAAAAGLTEYARYAPSELGRWMSCPGEVAVAHHNALARKEARRGKACGAVYPCMPGKGGKCTGCGEDD